MKPTYEDLQAEVWDLRWRLERAEQGDQSRDVVSAQAFLAVQSERDRLRVTLDALQNDESRPRETAPIAPMSDVFRTEQP